ncbi:MAG: hypothetical protein ACPGNV_11585 [Mangrovicoccus sp.]
MLRLSISALAPIIFLSACAAPPNTITPTNIPVAQFQAENCKSLQRSIEENSTALAEAEKKQTDHVVADAAGVALFFIPPSLFTGDAADEVALFKGRSISMKTEYTRRCQ